MNLEPGSPLPPPVAVVAPDDRALLANPTRQSPLALVFIAARFVRRLGVSALVAAVLVVVNAGAAIVTVTIAVVGAVALLVLSALSWWRFTFAVDGEELVVTRGILAVERLVIPLDRVQSVAIDQRLTHRLVGLVRAAVDTAGSTGSEFEIDAVDRRVAEALRRVTSDARDTTGPSAQVASAPTPAPDRVVVRRSWRELVVVGVTTAPWAGLAVLAPVLAFGDEIDQLGGVGTWLEARFDDIGAATDDSGAAVVGAVLALAAVVTVFGAVLQVVREVLTNWDVTFTRTATGLRRTAGLLSTTSRSSTLRRIQIVSTSDNPVQRLLGFTQLRLQVHGDNDLVLPGARPREVDDLRALAFGSSEPVGLEREISHWYVFRAVRNAVVVTAGLAIAGWFLVGWWSIGLAVSVPVWWATAEGRWRRHRWGLGDERVAAAHGLLRRRTAEAELVKTQSVTVTRSYFERRRGLASVHLRSADGAITIPLIGLDDALEIRDRVLYVVETCLRPVL